jgi:uncharacterized protein YcgI (DUF1989 family)
MARLQIPKGTAKAVTLREGQTPRIINVEGKQVADFIAFNAEDMTEFSSPIHTLELRALMNLEAAVSACPMDLNPISGYKTHDLAIEVV